MARKLKKTSKKVWRSFHPGIEICETLLDELDCENDEVLESPGLVEYQPFIIPKKPDRKPKPNNPELKIHKRKVQARQERPFQKSQKSMAIMEKARQKNSK